MILQGVVGPATAGSSLGSGVQANARQGQLGEMIVSELHGKYYEAAYRGNLFSGGTTIAALSANTITLTATTTPILGVWNPTTSTVNLVLSQMSLAVVTNNFTSGAGPGAFVWAASTGNGAITTGSNPWNRKTLTTAGSQAKYFPLSGATALTAITNNLVIGGGIPMPSPSALTYGTLVSTVMQPSFAINWDINGALVVPPGGVFAILNTTSCTVFSVFGELIWEEIPI